MNGRWESFLCNQKDRVLVFVFFFPIFTCELIANRRARLEEVGKKRKIVTGNSLRIDDFKRRRKW